MSQKMFDYSETENNLPPRLARNKLKNQCDNNNKLKLSPVLNMCEVGIQTDKILAMMKMMY